MKWLGENPFHTLLLLTEKPERWNLWLFAPISVMLAAGVGLLWANALDWPFLGWLIAGGLLGLALADGSLLAALPRWGLSYGAVQPPWLVLIFVRWVFALIALPFAVRWMTQTLICLVMLQALVWLMMVYGTLVEPFRLQVTDLEVAVTRLPNPGTSLRIVQLSDLHIERLTLREQALPALVAELNPDLLVLTGDLLSTSYNDDPRALADLRSLLRQLSAPHGVYAIWGTAEVDYPSLLRPILEDTGIIVLENQVAEVEIQEHHLWLVGISCTRDLVADGKRLHALLGDAPEEAVTILLYHLPDLMPQASAAGVDLYLAGHTHGGQWRVPGFGAILTSSRFWKRYEGGAYREGRTQLYVSRGIGMEGFGTPRARFFCRPEVVSISLRGHGIERR